MFEKLCNDLVTQRFALVDDFCGEARALKMRAESDALQARGAFSKAQVGRGERKKWAPHIRSDELCWISPSHDDDFAAEPFISLGFMRRLFTLRRVLNRALFMSFVKIECIATVYPPGAFYGAHVDRFEGSHSRVVSFVYFLNPGWASKDGGALELSLNEGPQRVEPLLDRLVLFQSEGVLHQVLESHTNRCALTGWFSVRSR